MIHVQPCVGFIASYDHVKQSEGGRYVARSLFV